MEGIDIDVGQLVRIQNFHKTSVEIDRDLLDRFKEINPSRGSIKYFINKCLETYILNHEGTLDQEISRAVNDAEQGLKELTV